MATSSTRRQAQLAAARPDLQLEEIRGNVPTRLEKLAENDDLAGTILAAAGLNRLHFSINAEGNLEGDAVPEGIRAVAMDTDLMLPCVGQAAIGIEVREDDGRIGKIIERLNHFNTFAAVTAERAFLRGMGGGCQSPVGRMRWLRIPSCACKPCHFSAQGATHRTTGALREPKPWAQRWLSPPHDEWLDSLAAAGDLIQRRLHPHRRLGGFA